MKIKLILKESKYDEERLKILADQGDEEAIELLRRLNSRKSLYSYLEQKLINLENPNLRRMYKIDYLFHQIKEEERPHIPEVLLRIPKTVLDINEVACNLIIHFEKEFDLRTRNKLVEIAKQDPFSHDKIKRYGY